MNDFLNFFIDMTFTDVGNKTQFDNLVNFEKMVSYLILICAFLYHADLKADTHTCRRKMS